ncbi:MAG: hypothetical protein JWO20_2630 [Candidatus Angelobacter sp.]|nr:hypothetical protein [Candidatus Angelobacter sp.]
MNSCWLLLLLLALTSTQSFSGTLTITPTTTLAAETAKNSSAADSFAGLPNGNAAPGNVSKLPIRNLLPGYSGKILAHYMPWWGKTSHISIGYSSLDPAQAEKTVVDMISRGYDGVMVSEASSDTWDRNGALTMFAAVVNHPGFLFSVSENSGAFSGVTDPTAKMIADMTFSNQHYFQYTNYLRMNGRPVVFIFDQNITGIDWAKAQAGSPGNPLFIFRNRAGFSYSYSNGGFSWIGFPSSTDLTGLGYLDTFYQTAATYSTKVTTGSAWKGFNDTVASWTKNRIIPQACGTLWISSLARATTNGLTSPTDILKVATWNDYEEGTELETGIDNCATMQDSVSGSTLNFAPTFSSTDGNESTVDHYQVFISTDGQNLMNLIQLPAGSRSLNLSSYSLAPGTYTFYVEMVGIPGILNRMSPAAIYTIAPPPPPPPPAPTVTLTSPRNNYPNAGHWMDVKAYATSTKAVTSMIVQVDGVTAATVTNVTSLNKWVYGSAGKWHYIQVLAYTNGVWVRSSTAKVYVSY